MASPKRIFVTGASGFVGREICRRLLADGHSITALLRQYKNPPSFLTSNERVKIHRGDVTNPSSLEGALDGHDAVIHLIGIIREIPERKVTFKRLHLDATDNMIKAAKKAGIERFIHMSALGASMKAKGGYFESKWLAEEAVRRENLFFTIFRPSLVYGPSDHFTNMIADMIRRFRAFPLIDGGINRLQPAPVEYVAAGFSMCIDMAKTIGRIYEVGGIEQLQFRQIVMEIASAISVKAYTPTVSVNLAMPIVKRFERYKWFPITSNQLDMLLMDNITQSRMYQDDFVICPLDFKAGIRKYLKHK